MRWRVVSSHPLLCKGWETRGFSIWLKRVGRRLGEFAHLMESYLG
jgi:hypothetical protein